MFQVQMQQSPADSAEFGESLRDHTGNEMEAPRETAQTDLFLEYFHVAAVIKTMAGI
jgi:hypothetical protein